MLVPLAQVAAMVVDMGAQVAGAGVVAWGPEQGGPSSGPVAFSEAEAEAAGEALWAALAAAEADVRSRGPAAGGGGADGAAGGGGSGGGSGGSSGGVSREGFVEGAFKVELVRLWARLFRTPAAAAEAAPAAELGEVRLEGEAGGEEEGPVELACRGPCRAQSTPGVPPHPQPSHPTSRRLALRRRSWRRRARPPGAAWRCWWAATGPATARRLRAFWRRARAAARRRCGSRRGAAARAAAGAARAVQSTLTSRERPTFPPHPTRPRLPNRPARQAALLDVELGGPDGDGRDGPRRAAALASVLRGLLVRKAERLAALAQPQHLTSGPHSERGGGGGGEAQAQGGDERYSTARGPGPGATPVVHSPRRPSSAPADGPSVELEELLLRLTAAARLLYGPPGSSWVLGAELDELGALAGLEPGDVAALPGAYK
jgi:hypothetical protein